MEFKSSFEIILYIRVYEYTFAQSTTATTTVHFHNSPLHVEFDWIAIAHFGRRYANQWEIIRKASICAAMVSHYKMKAHRGLDCLNIFEYNWSNNNDLMLMKT